ncbi:MAG: hypothetical protein R3C32_01100 [Chloroflexota bacterium]
MNFDDVPIFPKPTQKPYPPIRVGGHSEFALDRVATYGDVWMQPAQPRPVSGGRGQPARALRGAWSPGPHPVRHQPVHVPRRRRRRRAQITFDAVGQIFANEEEFGLRTIAGDDAFWIERLRLWADIGVTHVDIKPIYRTVPELLATMRRIAEVIAPEVEGLAAMGDANDRTPVAR